MKKRVIRRIITLCLVIMMFPPYPGFSAYTNRPVTDDMHYVMAMALGPNADIIASDNAKQVLTYLRSLPDLVSKKLISGQHLGKQGSFESDCYLDIAKSGYQVGLVGGDFQCNSDCSNFTSINPYLIQYWNAGSLVTICVHALNPQSGGSAHDASPVNFDDLLTPGHVLNSTLNSELSRWAVGLRELQEAGVVVLFRPWHEMNGSWFWWGTKNANPNDMKSLWRYTFDYLTGSEGIHNLIWVFNVNNGPYNASRYYPGDAYVDVVSIDVYPSDGRLNTLRDYRYMVSTGKPFAIGEYGPCSANKSGCDGRFDLRNVPADIRSNMPRTVFWMNWRRVFSLNNQSNLKEMFQDPWVIRQGEINYTDNK